MSKDRWDDLLEKDWSDAWNSLPDAPALIPREKTAQITLRLPARLLERIKRVAKVRSLPYHSLARSWIVKGLRQSEAPAMNLSADEPHVDQLNIKLDQQLLDELKSRANEVRRPYHRLGRELIEAELAREEENLGLSSATEGPAVKELMVLLLHATNKRGQDAIHGVTRLQKLLFVIEQKLASKSSGFYAFNYGPFNEGVNDAAEALRLAGFLQGTEAAKAGPPSFAEMMATAADRAGPREESNGVKDFALSEQGHEAAERLRHSDRAYDQLFDYVRRLREEWDTPDLVERVYETWPKYADRSLIRGQVAHRTARRRRPS
jgi:predicted DNA binding CopG/RHH family protein/uncharacterized protein YwgA